MATSENVSLLSRVKNFVSSPGWRKSDSPETVPGVQDEADKASIQAMMDRKLHNDVVRRREFELLRQMRRREPNASRGDLNERTSLFPSSTLSRPGGRAQTMKKIDEIEQQMSQQWWKGKQIRGGFPAPKAAAAPLAPSPAQRSGKPKAAGASTPLVDDTMQARLEASLYDDSQPSPISEFMPTQVNQFAHDPSMEDAAILFASGDYEGAAQFLMGLLRDCEVQTEPEEVWLTLFDLYRVTGDRTRFDGAAIDFASRFGRSAPLWRVSLEIEQQVAPEIEVISSAQGTDWTLSATLGPVALGKLKSLLAHAPPPWRLDWSQLASVEDAVVPDMADLFAQWCRSKVQLRFIGAGQLDEVLKQMTPSGNAQVQRERWLWRMDALRLGRREDEFELVALDYCITYEISPPAWEPPLCDFASSELEPLNTVQAEPVLLVLGESLLSTLAGAYSATNAGKVSQQDVSDMAMDAALGTQRFVLLDISGEVLGDASAALAKLDQGRAGFDKLVIDCGQLVRVDFPAAGGLLNWTSARAGEECKVEFKNVNRLVATFFSVIGIDQFARISPPAH
ncbi:MAG: STAS domain-containing protein [Betaproteobacteria bacterium]